MKKIVRTRFAPSPTGYLHIGAVRTALFAWLLARQHDGKFILRIEDTDKARQVDDAIEQIEAALNWLGIRWDEGPGKGNYGPYLQSERLKTYERYARQLLDEGKAYADPYSSDDLAKFREQAAKEKRPFHFNDHRPENPPEWQPGLPLRLKVEMEVSPSWDDAVRGPQPGSTENIDDFIIIKGDGYPTYNFAHIVDDHEMEISHILRGEEFISSMPKFMALYKALEIPPPIFAHLPQVLGPDKKKLSKRHGALDVLEYKKLGYLPEALRNFLVQLGWNDGTEQEFYTLEELLGSFSLERIQSSPAIFDQQRLDWINGHYLRRLEPVKLLQAAEDFWPESAAGYDESYKLKVLGLVQERLKFLAELPELTGFFFNDPSEYPDQLDKELAGRLLPDIIRCLNDSDFSEVDLEQKLRALAEEQDVKTGDLFKLIRLGITGRTAAPGLFETMNVLGREVTIKRLEKVASSSQE